MIPCQLVCQDLDVTRHGTHPFGAVVITSDIVQAKFGLIMTDTWLMELESIAEHKFSRHIIITIPGKAFAHNIHVGGFVHEVCGIAKQAESAEARLEVIKARSLKACIQYSSETRVACQHA